MKAVVIPIEYTEIGGKKWFYDKLTFHVQCAYCLRQQMLPIVREKEGDRLSLVLSLRLEEESHAVGCPQEVKEATVESE
jgi:hypothetical protein